MLVYHWPNLNTVNKHCYLIYVYMWIKVWNKSVHYLKQPYLFRRLGLIHAIPMDLFFYFFTNVLKHQIFGWTDFQWRDRNLSDLIKNILICVLKINKFLVVLVIKSYQNINLGVKNCALPHTHSAQLQSSYIISFYPAPKYMPECCNCLANSCRSHPTSPNLAASLHRG